MTPETAVQIVRQTLMTAFWLAAPLLLVGFVVGIIVSLVQIVTSIQDNGFNTVPRLVAFLCAILLSVPWMLNRLVLYTTTILGDLGRYAR